MKNNSGATQCSFKLGGRIVRRTCADSSFQPVSNLTVESAVSQFQHCVSGKALMFHLHAE